MEGWMEGWKDGGREGGGETAWHDGGWLVRALRLVSCQDPGASKKVK